MLQPGAGLAIGEAAEAKYRVIYRA